MRKYLLALLFSLFATVASAQTLLNFGLQTGANPRNACVWDTSNTCVSWMQIDSTAHTSVILASAIPGPTVSTLGGVLALSAASHQFVTGLNSPSGSLSTAQPAFTDISGSATLAQLPQIVGLSLLGVAGTSTANMAAITCAAANSVFNENAAATGLQCTTLTTVLDSMVGGVSRGAVLERGNSGWVALAPSATSGTLLQSAGSGTDPAYSTLGQLKAEPSNANASSGNIGEYITSQVLTPGSSITNNTAADITSISLTAGDWDVEGVVCAIYTTGAGTFQSGWVNSASATRPTAGALGETAIGASLTTASSQCQATGAQRFSLSGTTTAFLSILALFPNTATAFGSIRARRAR